MTKKVPFGYAVHPDNDKRLVPIESELEALEVAKRHLKQYSYRAVAQWLTRETGRYISHMGLKKRVDIEQRRRKAATIKRKLAKWLEETLAEIEKLETRRCRRLRQESATEPEDKRWSNPASPP